MPQAALGWTLRDPSRPGEKYSRDSTLRSSGFSVASQLKSFPPFGRTPAAMRRISALADSPSLLHAQRWFMREKSWINEQHLQLCRIPAATFFEQARAEWFR